MPAAPYDAIAEWYDEYARTQPLLADVVLPALLRLIDEAGPLRDRDVCDLACGSGVVAREMARRGARVVGIDISERLLAIARRAAPAGPYPVDYRLDDARVGATLPDGGFDGVACNMALMDIPDLDAALGTVRRVLRPGGWLALSLTHPCVQTPGSDWAERADGSVTRMAGDYFAEGSWRPTGPAGGVPGVRGRVGTLHRMLATYLNALIAAGLAPERLDEPSASDALLRQLPGYRLVPAALLMRCRAC